MSESKLLPKGRRSSGLGLELVPVLIRLLGYFLGQRLTPARPTLIAIGIQARTVGAALSTTG